MDDNVLPRDKAAAGTKADRTRARLVDAAIDEFAEFGFHDAKVSGIVARAGVSQPSFYLYFRTKEAIYGHLIQRVHDELLDVIEGARLPASVPPSAVSEKVRIAIEAFLQYFADNPKLAQIGYFADGPSSAIRDEIVALVSRNISFEQGAGYFRQELDPVFVSHCYNGSLERLIKVYLLSGQYDARELSAKVADVYMRGFLASEIVEPLAPALQLSPDTARSLQAKSA